MDEFPWISILIVAICVCLAGWAIHKSGQEMDRKCTAIMSLARTPRDTLDAAIACQQLRDAEANRMALAVAAGVVAGSMAGSK